MLFRSWHHNNRRFNCAFTLKLIEQSGHFQLIQDEFHAHARNCQIDSGQQKAMRMSESVK